MLAGAGTGVAIFIETINKPSKLTAESRSQGVGYVRTVTVRKLCTQLCYSCMYINVCSCLQSSIVYYMIGD